MPRTQDERFALLAALKAYFTAVPANESAEMEATAAACDAAVTALSDARQAVADAEVQQTTAFDARSVAIDGLRKRVRGLIYELETLIAVDEGSVLSGVQKILEGEEEDQDVLGDAGDEATPPEA